MSDRAGWITKIADVPATVTVTKVGKALPVARVPMVKAAVFDPAGTVTVAGADANSVLLSCMLNVAVPRTDPDNVSVAVVLCPPSTKPGLKLSVFRRPGESTASREARAIEVTRMGSTRVES